jgi:pimeloyl-ACP methyl ester carboxylesterase
MIRLLYVLTFILLSMCKNKNMQSSIEKDLHDPHTGYAPVNGLKMYYEIYGEGEPLVLVHGGGSTIQTTFGKIMPALAKNNKVIAVELQAHGHTADRDTPETFEQDADDVAALLQYLKISKASLFGFSNGGNTIMQVAIRHPQLVNKLIITSAFYKREGMMKGFFEGMEHATIDNMPQHLKDAYLEIGDSTGLMRMFNQDRNRMLKFKDWKDEDLMAIKAPSMIILGDKDVMTTDHAVKMSHLITNSRLMILPGTHGSFIGEGESAKENSKVPELVVEVINEFLRSK